MAKRFVERARRFQVSRKGELRLDEHRFNGLIQNISQKGGIPRSATTMVGTVVTRRSSMIRGLVSAT